MGHVINVGAHEIEAGCIAEGGSYHPTVTVRTNKALGAVRCVGYVFDESFPTQIAAMAAAEKLALKASEHPDRHLAGADGKFA